MKKKNKRIVSVLEKPWS